ncbi:MAG TPA: delta-60 repeat domain-containing protein [Rudaea sp.]|nr:delta-60 repeat domain-containing protein [Rudaea sp.]
MRIMARLYAVLLAALAIDSMAATNSIDSRFGTAGVVTLGPAPVSGLEIFRSYALAIQADGKILVAGRGGDPASPGAAVPAIGRLNPDGSWDTTFANNGMFILPTGSPVVPDGGKFDNISLFSDGSILASGGANASGSFQYEGCTVLAKLTDSGVLDTAFAPDHSGSFCFAFALPRIDTYYVHADAVAIDNDDTFYLTSPETNRFSGAVAHFDQTGALIPTFGFLGIAQIPRIYANLLQLLPDRTVLISGTYSESSTVRRTASSHLDTVGNIDGSYGVGGMFANAQSAEETGSVWAAIDAQGSLLISDDDLDSGATYQNYRFIRITASGQPDVSFNGNGQQPGYPGFAQPVVSGDANADYLVAAQPLPDGHIFAVGDAGPLSVRDGVSNLALLRMNNDASWDTDFGDPAYPGWASINLGGLTTSSSFASSIAMDHSGHMLITASVGGDVNGRSCLALIRVVPDRVFNDEFDTATPFPSCP